MLTPWLLLLLTSAPILAYPGGAPSTVCGNMLPRHGNALPQASKSSFVINTSATTVKPGAKVTVTLSGGQFKGYILEAINAANNNVVGIFTSVPSGSKTLNCGAGKSNAVTHNSAGQKSSVQLVWQASAKMAVGTKILFRATVLQNFQTFWSKIDSPTVVVSK